ncbi:MAG: O-antigen ligase family protein [Cytophagales bacterium]|nr:O-antigen ligase family protein [Armatimonadota bacterium]
MSIRPAAARDSAFHSSSLSLRGILADHGLLGTVGIGSLLLALVLAPLIGGYPPGAVYGADTALLAVRLLVCLAGVLIPPHLGTLLPPPSSPPAGGGEERGNGQADGSQRLFFFLPWLTFGLTLLSLLVHSRFLTSEVLLFALLPATLDWLCYALAATLSLRLARQDPRFVTLLTGALILGAAGVAITIARSYGAEAQAGNRGFRASGTFFSPNFAGGFLGLCLPIAAAACLAARERIGALVLGTITALSLGALVATGSRAGIAIAGLGLFVALLLALVSQRGGEARLPWARVGALLAAFALLGFAFRGPLTARAEGGGSGGGDEHSGAYRTLTWKGVVAMAAANPLLGTGPGTFSVRYPPYALVARTDLAHSSYLQTASEQGFPALATAIGTIAAVLFAGVAALLRRSDRGENSSDLPRLLLCGVLGGVVAGGLRSVFDSEWSLLGNGLAFWASIGLAGGIRLPPPVSGPGGGGALAPRIAAALGLVFSLLLFQVVQVRDAAEARYRQTRRQVEPVNVWPPDPNLLLYAGRPQEAARVEPSGKRWYQFAESLRRVGRLEEAITAYRQATKADPNALQTWRKLASVLQEQGRRGEALEAWRRIAALDAGLVGQVRAIPELREIHPAFAYAALATDAAARGARREAVANYEKAARVVEVYSNTTPQYQQMELYSAAVLGTDVEIRRQEARALYAEAMARWAALQPERRAEIEARRDATNARLDKFLRPDGGESQIPTESTLK